jgi:hypothetical protein
MSSGISGNYDGEGANVAPQSPTTPGPIVASPDKWAQTNALGNKLNGGQGRQVMATFDRRGRVRTSSESARSALAVNVGGGDQVLGVCARALYVSVTGTIVVRLADDTADVTFANLTAGVVYPLAIALVRSAGTSGSYVLLF